jgi:hypothetical protein
MSKNKTQRCKKYKPKPVRAPMIVGADLVISPLDLMIDQIDKREEMLYVNDTPVFLDADARLFDASEAIAGLRDFFEMWSIRHQKDLDLYPLEHLISFVMGRRSADQEMIDSLRSCARALRSVMAFSDPEDQIDLFHQVKIKSEIERSKNQRGAL